MLELNQPVFRPGVLYKHRQNTDVAFMLRHEISSKDGAKLSVNWFNIVNQPSYIGEDTIFIKTENFSHWAMLG